jgi:hypothetical protein
MKDTNYIVIQGWMVNKLKLSGNELMLYAVIYGFSQDGKSGYEGGAKYLYVSCGVSRRTLTDILISLVKKNFILKEYFTKNGVKFCRYKTNPVFISKEEIKDKENKDDLSIKIEDASTESMADSAIGYGENCHRGMAKTAMRYGRNRHRGMAESAHNNTADINLNTAAAAPVQPDSNSDPPEDGKAEAAALLTPDKIKDSLSALDKRRFFDKDFYSKAAAVIARHKSGIEDLRWLHEQCGLKKPDSFGGYYFSVFFLENKAEQYKALSKPSDTPPPQPVNVKCPVCSIVHEKNAEMCPNCSLPKDSPPQQISLFRELLTFPVDRRNEYLKRENVIYSEFKGDTNKLKIMIDSLKKEFRLGRNREKSFGSYHSRL